MPQLPRSATELTPWTVSVAVGVVAFPALWVVDQVTTANLFDPPPAPVVVAMIVWPVCIVVAVVWVVMVGLVKVFGPGKPSAGENGSGHHGRSTYPGQFGNYDLRHPPQRPQDPWGRR